MEVKARSIIFSDVQSKNIDFQNDLLEQYGIETVFFAAFGEIEDLISELKSVDFAIFFFRDVKSFNLYHLGMCDALNVRSVIFCQVNKILTFELARKLISFVDFGDKLWFKKLSVDLAIDNALKDAEINVTTEKRGTEKSVDSKIYEKIRSRLSHAKSEQELAVLLAEFFTESKIIFNFNQTLDDSILRPDFVIWSSDLEYVVGNPLIIEVKRGHPRQEDIDQISKYMDNAKSSIGIILYQNMAISSVGQLNILSEGSSSFGFGTIENFINDMTTLGIKDAVIRCLNKN